MGLTIHQAPYTPVPSQLALFLASATAVSPRSLFTDGSFTLHAPLLDMLSLTPTELSSRFATTATGKYLPPSGDAPVVALIIRTQQGDTAGAYYQELLGIAVAFLVSTVTPIETFSDCSSAIRRVSQAASVMGTAVEHLQHGAILQGIRALAAQRKCHSSLRKRAQTYNFQQYRKKRDMYNVYANMPTRWTRFSPSLMSTLTRIKKPSPRQVGRRTKHLFDWMAHSHNLAKVSP
jgi:hypothetical protein